MIALFFRLPAQVSLGKVCIHPYEEILPVALSHSFQAFVDPCPVGHS